MMQSELLAEQIETSRKWTLRLIADLRGDDWTFQPAPGMAHALWLCGHLTSAEFSLVHIRCLGAGAGTGNETLIDDTFKAHFPTGVPVQSATEHDYPSVQMVLARMNEVHAKTVPAVLAMDDALLAEPAYAGDGKSLHPDYRDKRGAVSHCSRHEAFHAGQIATIRRLLNRPFLR